MSIKAKMRVVSGVVFNMIFDMIKVLFLVWRVSEEPIRQPNKPEASAIPAYGFRIG